MVSAYSIQEMTGQMSEAINLERKLVPLETEIVDVPQGRLLVVVIGINDYVHWQKLKNAVQDAVGLQQTLIDKLGFSAPVPPLINEAATKAAINSLIEDQLREELQEDDNLVLFFAGHGHTRLDKVGGKVVGETGFIVPVEGRGPKEVWGDYIQIDPLLQSISRLPARHILVILDSCHSGFALGEAMRSFRDAVRYEKDLSSRISRKVITSARREQLALDGGPVSGHSLFTGTLVDGFNWGKADLDGNGLITSSELGLFIQQQVGQASESRQTPDFGSFYLDDRGEMVISLRDQSFEALKARASSALQSGKFSIFKELVQQIIPLKSANPEILYLEYRLSFLENDFRKAAEIIDRLLELDFKDGAIPLVQSDLLQLQAQFYCWQPVLEIPNRGFPLEVTILAGPKTSEVKEVKPEIIGETTAYSVEPRNRFQFSIKNSTDSALHIYMVWIDSSGHFEPLTLWDNEDILLDGLPPHETKLTYPFIQTDSVGMCEVRLFSSPKRLRFLLFPASPGTKGYAVESIKDSDLEKIGMKSIRYSMNPKLE